MLAMKGNKFSDGKFRLWPILWPPLHQNDTFSDIQEQQKAFLEAQDACKISVSIVGFRLTIPELSDQNTDAIRPGAWETTNANKWSWR
jgi:hypothetical protein